MRKHYLSQHLPCLRFRYFTHLIGCMVMICLPQLLLAQSKLPDIGSPASAELSPAKEMELGHILIAEVRRRLPVSNDPELSQYIHALGTRITSGGLDSNLQYNFLLVINPSINAFALPGGIVAINSGLLTLAEQESELAGVMAHEIAHVSQRHIARRFENEKSFGVISALTLLGSILAAVYNVDLGQAALMGSQAGILQAKLAYSRSFEQEADRIALQLLVSAGIDPMGMPRFFYRMHKATQVNRGQIPEFLSSHPLTLDRLSETETRARQFRGLFPSNSSHFDFAKARVLALSKDSSNLVHLYRKKSKHSERLSDTERYTFALALSHQGNHGQALRHLGDIQANSDNELTIELAKAQINIAMGKTGMARESLESLDKIYPKNIPVTYYLATSLIKEDQAHRALEKLDQLNKEQLNPAIYKLKAKAANRAGLPWLSHESLGDYYAAHGQYGAAMEQIDLALHSHGIDSNSKARIEARKAQLTEIKQRQKQFK